MSFTPQTPRPELLGCVTSTNEVLATRWRENPGSLDPYASIVSRHQRQGRGRLGRTWSSPAGSSLLLSVLVPVPASATLSWMPLYAGLAVQQLLEAELPQDAQIDLKWPNDILVDNRKVAGILCEYLGEYDGTRWVVVGIGINLSQSAADFGPLPATSLLQHGWDLGIAPEAEVPEPTRLRIAWTLSNSLATSLAADSHTDDLAQRYRAQCVTLGQRVQAKLPDNTIIRGTADDLSADGGLLIRTDDNLVHTVSAGDVTLLKTELPQPKETTIEVPRTVCEECQ